MDQHEDRQPRILVVDDDAKIVHLVRTYLVRDGFRVTTARTGPEGVEAFRRSAPDLIVLDLMLPELDGLEVCRVVRSEAVTPILMLSARGAPLDRIHGLEEGADDYLAKPFSPAELVARVKAILRRAPPPTVEGGQIEHAGLRLDLDRYEAWLERTPVQLTTLEFRLLETLLRAGGRVLTRAQLLDAVHGRDAEEILDRTIDVHIGRVRDKLGDDADDPRYIATVRGIGYRAAMVRP